MERHTAIIIKRIENNNIKKRKESIKGDEEGTGSANGGHTRNLFDDQGHETLLAQEAQERKKR